MRLFFPTLAIFGLLILPGCQSTPGAGGSRATAESLQLTNITPEELPEDPIFIQANQECVFFVRSPKDGSMVAGGVLKKGTPVILRKNDGEWTDVQLTSGHLGSVFSINMTGLDELVGF